MMESFYYKKLLQMLVFSTEDCEFFAEYRKDILNKQFLIELKTFIIRVNAEQFLNQNIKYRLSKILNFISTSTKNNLDDLKEKISKENKLNYNKFVINEINKRTDGLYLEDYLNSNNKNSYVLYNSIGDEFYTYKSHSNLVTDKEFEDYTSLDFVVNHSYFDSLNSFYTENKKIFDDELFKKRMNIVFEYNNEIYKTGYFRKTYIPYDKDLIKRQEKIKEKLKR